MIVHQCKNNKQSNYDPAAEHPVSRKNENDTVQGGSLQTGSDLQIQSNSGASGGIIPLRSFDANQSTNRSRQGSCLKVQCKFTVRASNDKYEQEADRLSEKILNSSEASILQRQCTACEEEVQKDPLKTQISPLIQHQPLEYENIHVQPKLNILKKPFEEKEALMQMKHLMPGKNSDDGKQLKSNNSENLFSSNFESHTARSQVKGYPLPRKVQTFMENKFGVGFGQVKIHTDRDAVQTNKALNSRAFTHKNSIYFNSGSYNPDTSIGRQLLAHELTHVIQQNADDQPDNYHSENSKVKHFSPRLTIQKSGSQAESSGETYHIDYEYAREENNYYQNQLGWGVMLGVAKKGLFKEWLDLWDAQKYNKFADSVAQYQWVRGLEPTGIIDEITWGKIADFSTAAASITKPDEKIAEEFGLDTENVCTDATECRLRQAASMTGVELEMPEGKTMDMFRMILHTSIPHLKNIPEEYRGTGAAGAMVYAGMGVFVDEEGIWNGALQPGAVIQVWMNKIDFDNLKKGEVKSEKDLSSLGTSLVFVRYENDGTEMVVRHKTKTEYKKRTSYGYWIAANPKY